MFKITQRDENSDGFPSFELTHENGKCLYGHIDNMLVKWNWRMSDGFSPSEMLDALDFVIEEYNLYNLG